METIKLLIVLMSTGAFGGLVAAIVMLSLNKSSHEDTLNDVCNKINKHAFVRGKDLELHDFHAHVVNFSSGIKGHKIMIDID